MDASQYKDYVLVVLFVKYISDRAKSGDPDLEEIPAGCTFDDFIALKHKDQIGDEINKKLAKLASTFGLDNVFVNADFESEDKLGKGKDKVDTITSLIEVFENPNLDFSTNRAGDDDLIGDAYEYLMRNFASQSGKSKGQFYTPAEVSRLMAKIIGIRDDKSRSITIYDPACGSGSLLLRAMNETARGTAVNLYGQEKDLATINMARMNMILHGMYTADLQHGDTLNVPLHHEGNQLQQFQYVVANPPFSLKKWKKSAKDNDVYGRWKADAIPPSSKGDYAFLMHIVKSILPDGKGACILPHGVLFRGSVEKGDAEAKLRKALVESHIIKGIIGLPANLFYGTGIPACIIIIDKAAAKDSKGIFMIDAKDGFYKDGAKNRLREQDIQRIADAWAKEAKLSHFSRLVPYSEIEKNEYNLNIPRYIQPRSTEIQQDLYAHLHGGLPKADVDALEALWDVCPSLRDKIFEPHANKGYLQLTTAASRNLAGLIADDASFKAQNQRVLDTFEVWKKYMRENFPTVAQDCIPREKIEAWSKEMLRLFAPCHSLIDSYAVYDELMKYWNEETMQDDLYMVSRDGWKVTVKLPITKNGKNKGKTKKSFDYDELECDLVPVNVLIGHFFAKEAAQIEKTEQMIDAEQVSMEAIAEEFSDSFEDIPFENVNGNFIKGVRALIKEGKRNRALYAELLEVWEDFDKHAKAMEKQKDVRKDLIKKLTASVQTKYSQLTEKDIRELVFEDKWMPSLLNRIRSLMESASSEIENNITSLNERYDITLPEIEESVGSHRELVKGFLKEMGISL
jgi:type I restriction enzyme M protein